MKISFKRDTAFRKQFFVPDSFAHPAKMDAQLLIWLVERYTKVGEVILDPMAGSGTLMLACGLGRDVVLVELEEKFCKMCRDNWELVKMRPQLGYQMGTCQIIRGDARQLEGLLVDKCIFSPPYAEKTAFQDNKWMQEHEAEMAARFRRENPNHPNPPGNIRASKYRYELQEKYSDNPDNIGNLPYGQIDKIVTSPPFGEAQSGGGIAQKGYQGDKHSPTDLVGKRSYMPENIGDNPDQISRLPYGNIDSIITSPPYEEAMGDKHFSPGADKLRAEKSLSGELYSNERQQDRQNIGNLKSQSYLEAMLQVYQQCHKVLKLQGLMILVTKNFIRNKQIVRLDEDTIKLCEQAGFSFLERHERKLPSQSFWRIIYAQKHPEVEQINCEDILVFAK